jgi:hypothetical protein
MWSYCLPRWTWWQQFQKDWSCSATLRHHLCVCSLSEIKGKPNIPKTAKVGWPYLLTGRIRYNKRVGGCCSLSFLGMLVSAYLSHLRTQMTVISSSPSLTRWPCDFWASVAHLFHAVGQYTCIKLPFIKCASRLGGNYIPPADNALQSPKSNWPLCWVY